MTSPATSPPAKGMATFIFALSVFVGLGSFGVAGGVGSYLAVKRTSVTVRAGWSLTPVVVAAKRLEPGELVPLQSMSQRSVPEVLVTSSMVKPEAASTLVGQPVLVAVEAGEPLRWAFFLGPEDFSQKDQEVGKACAEAVWGSR
jgi:Flp pilus assembly protein CpaB